MNGDHPDRHRSISGSQLRSKGLLNSNTLPLVESGRTTYIMLAAVVLAIALMLFTAGWISNFVNRHPTVKMLALEPPGQPADTHIFQIGRGDV